MENQDQFKYLYDRYLANQATPEETDQLFQYIASEKNNEQLKGMLSATWDQLQVAPGSYNIKPITIPETSEAPVRRLSLVSRLRIKRIAIAASMLLVIGLGAALVRVFTNQPEQEIATTQQQRFKNDISPGGYKARLTLADGREIILDSAAIGELTIQGKTAVINKDGQLVYEVSGKVPSTGGDLGEAVIYNTLRTSRGETYSTILADGSKVWLNSGSSLRYPVAFAGKERRVEITGEAYFEVKHNEKMPFIVSVNGMEVHDLGTEFNINAYSDEAEIRTTLVSGSAKVVLPTALDVGNKEAVLSPGQQAVLTHDSRLTTHDNADIAAATAWKNGIFKFSNASIEQLMRQMARWYDVEVIYETTISDHFVVTIPRTVSMINAFKILEETGTVKFRIEGKRVVVMK